VKYAPASPGFGVDPQYLTPSSENFAVVCRQGLTSIIHVTSASCADKSEKAERFAALGLSFEEIEEVER
jgi:hypothetical protein